MNNIINHHHFTEREQEVIECVLAGMTNPQIAEKLCITTHTVKAHISSILNKLGVKNRVEAILTLVNESLDKNLNE